MIEFKELIKRSNYKKELEETIKTSNLAFKHWETYWTSFISTYVCEEIIQEFENLDDFNFFIYGGFDSAQRSKIACFRKNNVPDITELMRNFPAKGIQIEGNFLFDNATQNDFRTFLSSIGFEEETIGDIWVTGDRGAQGIINNSGFEIENDQPYYLRDVEVKIKIIDLNELNIPTSRSKKLLNTVEASTRLDAIASAGYRISRKKILERINSGLLKLNGHTAKKTNINLKTGDKLELENKGFLEILDIEKTKRERWKIKLLKK